MIQGNQMPPNMPQVIDGLPPDADAPTSVPVQAVDADQLPREKGLTYEEVTSIIGSLYLDSHHQMKVREEQFAAVIEEYDKRIMQMQAQAQIVDEELTARKKEVYQLKRELETRDGQQHTAGASPASGDDWDNSVSSGK